MRTALEILAGSYGYSSVVSCGDSQDGKGAEPARVLTDRQIRARFR
jgi:hypothetical protein